MRIIALITLFISALASAGINHNFSSIKLLPANMGKMSIWKCKGHVCDALLGSEGNSCFDFRENSKARKQLKHTARETTIAQVIGFFPLAFVGNRYSVDFGILSTIQDYIKDLKDVRNISIGITDGDDTHSYTTILGNSKNGRVRESSNIHVFRPADGLKFWGEEKFIRRFKEIFEREMEITVDGAEQKIKFETKCD